MKSDLIKEVKEFLKRYLIYIILFISVLLNILYFINTNDYHFVSTEDFNNIVTPIAAIIALVYAYKSWKTSEETNKLSIYQKAFDLHLIEINKLITLFKEIEFNEHKVGNEIIKHNISNSDLIIEIIIDLQYSDFSKKISKLENVDTEMYINLNKEYDFKLITLRNYFNNETVLMYLNSSDTLLKVIINDKYLNKFFKNKLAYHFFRELSEVLSFYENPPFENFQIITFDKNTENETKNMYISTISELKNVKKIKELRKYYFNYFNS